MSDGRGASDDSLLRRIGKAPPLEPPLPLPEPGERLGRFELYARLGRGAMGVVYAARDEVLGRDVALKLVAHDGVRDETRARLLREARSTAKVVHPGIATVHDALEVGDQLVLVLELVRGRTLRRAIADAGGALSRDAALRVMAAVAHAVHAAHLAGVVHRDLKPDNVMLTDDDGVKVLDFGLAAAMGEARADGVSSASSGGAPSSGASFAGTPGYAAPEAARGHASALADQYSLGVMLLECLSGARGVGEASWSKVPRSVRGIALRATAISPKERYPSCAALARRIERARRRAGVRIAAGLGAASAVAGALLLLGSGDGSDSTVMRLIAPPPPAVAAACPQLATAREEDGWLGAAAASLVCREVRALLGGGEHRALPPAALLDLPSAPAADFPREPFGEPGARERANDAAEASGRLVVGGSIARTNDVFSVELTASRAGVVIATGQGTGGLLVAVDHAVEEVFSGPALVPASSVDADVARWTGIHRVDVLRDFVFADGAVSTGGATREAIARIDNMPGSFGPHAAAVRSRLAASLGERADTAAPAIETGSSPAFARTAIAHVLLGGATSPGSLAGDAAERRKGEATSFGRATLLDIESLLRLSAGQRDDARTLALASCLDAAWDCPWSVLAHASFGRPEFATLSRAYRAWVPEMADAWNIAAHVDVPESRRALLLERAYVLGDAFPLYAGNYGSWLLIGGRADEARAVAARLETGTAAQKIAASKLTIEIALSEGRVLAAYEASAKALAELPRVANILTGDVALLALYVELGVLLGRGPETARDVYERFVRPDPPRVDTGPFAKGAIAHACAYAAPDIAVRCFDRLEELERRGWFPLGGTGDADAYAAGARAFAVGDDSAAVGAFRRVRSDLGVRASVAALAFERAGELDLADSVDPPRTGVFGGLSQSSARSARRAYRRGDCDAALPVARSFTTVWAKADAELGIVAEMRKIAAACCRHDKSCG